MCNCRACKYMYIYLYIFQGVSRRCGRHSRDAHITAREASAAKGCITYRSLIYLASQQQTVIAMCEEVWRSWRCAHLTCVGYYACDDWSDAHPEPNHQGSESCANYRRDVVHHTEIMDIRCNDCAHLPSPPESEA
ncbi:hypothetical protein F4777DRAFT_564557 [Nemania sp. FL0916]|nr:hypothetical protein F4777DRAFT_564557 [Nemania sp. FL0916]